MSHYVHHVPGRLRVRSKNFRCNSSTVQLIEAQLRNTDGVLDVKYNDRTGSLTIQYDPDSKAKGQVMHTLTEAGCFPIAEKSSLRVSSDVASTFSKALITAVAQQTVTRSFTSLLTILR